MSKCPNCGKENRPSANFCGRCGARLPAETPAASQEPQQEASGSQPAAMAPGREKRFWKKAVVPVLVLAAAVLLLRWIGQSRSCETCNEILGLQEELLSVLAENEDNSLTMDDYDRWEIKVSALSSEIQMLKDHECSMPIRKVKDHAYFYGRYEGTYTGEWKSTAPCGEGVFSGEYQEGSRQAVLTYSGEWAAGAPNGEGSLMEYEGYSNMGGECNWLTRLYEGTFVNGALTGSGWSCRESSTGDRYEYYDGVYQNGMLEGQANFLQYLDGGLYDKGIAEGYKYMTVYSERQEILNAIDTAGAVLIAGVAAKCLFDVIDITLNGTDSSRFQNSSAGKWLEQQREAIAADEEMWRQKKEKEESRQQLYNTWQNQEKLAQWWEDEYEKDRNSENAEYNANYFRRKANEDKAAYDAY